MMRFVRLPAVILQKRALSGVDLTGSNLTAARLAASDLSGPDVRPAADAFANRRLAGLRAGGIRAIEVDFSGSLLTGATFRRADLRGAVFKGCDLRGASFVDCQLAFSDFSGTVMGAVRKAGGAEFFTDFSDANVTGAVFDAPPPAASRPLELDLAC